MVQIVAKVNDTFFYKKHQGSKYLTSMGF